MSLRHAELKPHDSDVDDHLSDENETADFDRPRVAQWVDEEDLDEDQSEDESPSETHSNSNIGADEKYNRLGKDLSKLPLGAIVKARKTMKRTEASSSSSSEESESEMASEPEDLDEEHAKKKSKEAHHRSNKHAPTELSSKKPITRRRQVVEVHHSRPRDPRFSDLSGSLDINRYHSQYGFLNDMHKEEFSTLKTSLARARKLLATSPSNLRESREKEVERLEKALKKTESVVNRERHQQVESQALNKLRKEEKEKQKTGKKAWWLKKSDEKAIRQRARLDALAESGGQRAVKKAEERKQRKIGQKEKKSRPFPAPPRPQPANDSSGSNKRSGDNHGQHSRTAKRPRLDR